MATSSTLCSVLNNLLHRQNTFCCLCFNGVPVQLIDLEEIVDFDQEGYKLSISDVFTALLGDEITEYLSTFNRVCNQCLQQAVNGYMFVKTAKLNSDLLTNALNGISHTFDNMLTVPAQCKSLFVSLNTEESTTKMLYDSKRPVQNVVAAYRRFHAMVNKPQMRPKLEIEIYPAEIKKEKKNTSPRITSISPKKALCPSTDGVFKCGDCHKVFPHSFSLRNHYMRVHAPKTIKCPDCPRKYACHKYLEAHKAESHCSLVCSECGKVFKNRQTFKMHEESHYLRLICHDCGRTYKNKTTYRKHIEFNVCGQKTRASPADAKFTCDYCGKKYTQKVSLRVHIQYEHMNYKAHECQFCKKKFWAQSRLKAHMVKHTKERNFACTLCNGKFVTRESLLYHTRTHTGDKPYKCSYCNIRFLSASRRSEHIKRQHANPTIECDMCGCKFTSQRYLYRHRKTHVNPADPQPVAEKMVTPEKVNEEDFKQLTQDLKKMESEEEHYNLILGW